jgi:hypothetical protein
MNVRRMLSIVALSLALTASRGMAQDVEQSKSYFKAGAAAYEMGDYLAAIQALEAAYRLTPLPAIAFSLAQAERRQYFVSRERAHLERALELYRQYLHDVTIGGRRADATDALGQLEPLALANAPAGQASDAGAVPETTRLMITCDAPKASISLDGAPAAASPLIAQVSSGPHRVAVSAPGFFPTQRGVDAVEGALVPLDVTLRAQPAVVVVRAKPDAELHIDGALLGKLGHGRRLELSGGQHRFTFARAGYSVRSIDARLPAGTTREISVELEQTTQRSAAIGLFVGSSVLLAAGAVFTGLAVDRENVAAKFLARRASGNVTPAELHDYTHATEQRNRDRMIAVVGFTLSAATLVTALALYALDQPEPLESTASPAPTPAPAPELHVSLPMPGTTQPLALDARIFF